MKLNKTLRISAIILLLILGFAAIYGGWMLISDPGGQKLQFSLDLLDNTPFNDYLIPGFILFIVIGLLSFVVIIITILKIKNYAWFIILQGCLLIGWLTIEILLNNDFFSPILHYPCYIIGILLVTIGFISRKHPIKQK